MILDVMCKFRLVFAGYGGTESFRRRFAAELGELDELAADGLIEIGDDSLQVTKVGRLLIRNIAMVFAEWLRRERSQTGKPPSKFSRTG